MVYSEESYRTARAKFEEDGHMILDATLEGACNIGGKTDCMKLQK